MSFSLSRTLRVLRLPLFCVLLWWVGVGSAQAAITCTAQMSDLNFGTVDLVDGSTPPSPIATLDYTCTNNGTSAETVRVCFNIGDGDEGLTNFNPRVMKSGTNSLKFQLYQGTSNVIWGSSGNGVVPNPFIATFSVPRRISSTVPASVSASTTMRGDLLAGQGTAPPGAYQDNFGSVHTSITFSSSTTGTPTACNGTAADNFPFLVKATVAKSCLVTADPLNFGTIDGLPGMADRDQFSTINVTCTTPTSYTVALTPSNNSTTGAGAMTPTGGVPGNTDAVPYRLYSNAGRSASWGSATGTNTVAGTGTGTAQTLTVYGRVLGSSVNVRPDSYRDVVTVTVSY
ncbi:spore coat protein U-like protein [Variovorax paradoxus]|uniref:Spore coat protein U-like protein n=1 Tax=Variovorax paradoxus TaxID=34073 RepID=A0AAW8EPZ2_VARPD|nr:spore coat U domain-containing protein [Variovorax paradoxus]MDP9975045.1 spore coat protein U-like protein [Variovorax paradoxus]